MDIVLFFHRAPGNLAETAISGYTAVNTALAGHFALACFFSSVANGLDSSRQASSAGSCHISTRLKTMLRSCPIILTFLLVFAWVGC